MNLGDVCLSRFWERLFGLSPFGSLGEKYRGSVFIPNCRSIHTFTLRNPIDLEWVDFDGKLIRRECSVPPRSIRRCPQAYGVRERYSNQRCPSQEGWVATETVLVLPLVLMIFFFAMQLAYIAIAKVHLGHALREGMRAASAALSAPDANSTHGASKARMDSFAGPESAIDNDGQTVVQDAFEDAIFRVLGAWSAFYGEAQGEEIGDIGVGGLGPHLKWVATLQPGYLQPRDLQPRLVQPNGIPSNSSDGAPFGSDAPDHLVGALTLRVPLKMPFFGPSLAQIFSVHEDCRAELEGSMLCLEANRWYWKLRARARIPLPTSLRFEGFVIGKAVSTPEKGVTHAQSKPKDDSSDRSHQEITAVPSVNDKSSRQLPFSVLPQTIAALAEELQAVAPRASERGDAAVADCGIQFGN